MTVETTEKNELTELKEALDQEMDLMDEQEVKDPERIKAELTDLLVKYFMNKEIVKEKNEENKLVKEEIEELFELLEDETFIYQGADGEFMSLSNRVSQKSVLDLDTLALELQMDKKELKTPWDFSMLTKQGKLEPKTIARHTETQTLIKTKIAKTKRKPKAKKERS